MPTNPEGPRLLRREDVPGSMALIQAAFGQTWQVSPNHAPFDGETWLITQAGRPASQISIFWTDLKMYDAVIRVGSIGGVCTLPECRGLGLASQLMAHCTQRLVERGATLMLISGARGLYLRLGAVVTGRTARWEVTREQASAAGDRLNLTDLSVRRARPEDALACSRIYQQDPIHFRRRLGVFEHRLSDQPLGGGNEALIIEWKGQPAAYLMLDSLWTDPNEPTLLINEHRAVNEYAGSRAVLAAGLPLVMQHLNIKRLTGWSAWQDADWLALVQPYSAPLSWGPLGFDDTLRIINFPGLMAGLKPYLETRLDPRLRRTLRFEQAGPLLGGLGEDIFTIQCGPDRLALDGATMTRLVFNGPAKDGMEPTGVDLSGAPESIQGAARALFPLPIFQVGLDYH